MPKREKEIQVKRINHEELRAWVEQTLLPGADELDEKQKEQMAHKVANLADVASVIDFYIRVHNQEMHQIIMSQAKDISVLRSILVDNTEVTNEDIKKYSEDFEEKLEADRKLAEKIREFQSREGDLTDEEVEEFEELIKELTGGEDLHGEE